MVRGDEDAFIGVDRGQRDLGAKVLASRRRPVSGRPAPIGRCRGSATYPASARVHGAGGTWDQNLDRLADKLRTLVAEQSFRLGVD